MALDRRLFCSGLLMAFAAAACEAKGSSPTINGTDWQTYRDRFLATDGRIIDNGNGGISHSEGQGYGLLLALAASDKEAFTRIAHWADTNLARGDVALYSWRYDPRSANPVSDRNNATDGDMLIAWALAEAGKRWKIRNYADRSTAIRRAIRQKCVVQAFDRWLLLPGIDGFAQPAKVTVNPSYFIWPALDAFARADGAQVWQPVIDDSTAILKLARFGPHNLPTDWLVVTGKDAVAPAEDKPPRFGFDAVRIPLYASMGRRPALASDIALYWRANLALKRPIPGWIDVVTNEEAPYPLPEGGQAIVARALNMTAPSMLSTDYYAATLQMLSRQKTAAK